MAMLVQPRFKPQPPPGQVQQTLRDAPAPAVDVNGMTPQQVARQRQIAEQMAQVGTDYSPVEHWAQGAARLANAAVGGWQERKANEAEKAGRASASEALNTFLSTDDPDPKARVRNALVLAQNPWLDEVTRSTVMQQAIPKEPETTGTQREYQAAKAEGFPGSFMDYQMQLNMARGGLVPNPQQPGAFTPVPGGPADQSMKPPPATVQTKEDEDIDAIGASNSMNATIDDITKRIDDKKLDLGFFTNWLNYGRNVAGQSTPKSVEYAAFDQSIKKMQNDILTLHNGVQTEGDAIRALQQIVTNPTDTEVVKRNLAELKKLNDRALQLRKQKIDLRRERNRMVPIDPADLGLPAPVVATPAPPGEFTPTDGGTLPVPAPAGAPQPGMIEDGMRFKGGNPADPNSWEPVTGPAGGPEMMAPPGPQMAPPPAPDPYQLQDLTRRREEMLRRHKMLRR